MLAAKAVKMQLIDRHNPAYKVPIVRLAKSI